MLITNIKEGKLDITFIVKDKALDVYSQYNKTNMQGFQSKWGT